VSTPRREREVVEGAIACVLGRDLDENVYVAEHAPESHRLWEVGWQLADCLLEREFAVGLRDLGEAA
jgi:hypothetical protein